MADVILDSYAETNQSAGSAGTNKPGQSFTTLNDGIAHTLEKAKAYMYDDFPGGYSVTAKIYAHSGVYGTSSIPTGAALATSDAVTTGITGSYQLITFTFSGANRIALSPNTHYCIAFSQDSGGSNIIAGVDNTAPSHAGNHFIDSGGWTPNSAIDLCFYVYTIMRSLTITSVSNGSTYPAAGTTYYSGNTSVVVYALANRCYILSSWTLDTVVQSSKASRFTVSITSDHVLTPAFAAEYATSTMSIYADIKNQMRKEAGVTNFNVTLHALSLGAQDSDTGVPAKSYADSTIEMLILTRDNKNIASQIGKYVALDALGWTTSCIRAWDKITTATGKRYFIDAVKPILDPAAKIVCFEAQLTEEVMQ